MDLVVGDVLKRLVKQERPQRQLLSRPSGILFFGMPLSFLAGYFACVGGYVVRSAYGNIRWLIAFNGIRLF